MSTAKVFVGSLPPGCKPEELRHLFTNYGVVVECDIMNRCGFVHLETIEMAEAAIAALNGVEFKGQAIVVEPGRPKDRRGGGGGGGAGGAGGGGGGAGGGAGNRRPVQGRGGGTFTRGGHTASNSFRSAGGNRSSSSNGSQFAPMRNEGHFRQHRSTPYSKGLQQHNQSFDGPRQPFKKKFSQGMASNDYYANSSAGAGGGGGGGQRSSGSGHNIGQDRRGFALPAVDHHHNHQQQQHHHHQSPFAAKQSRFGNSPMVSSGSNAEAGGMYQRNRNNAAMNSGSTQGSGRAGFNASRGGFSGRGGGFSGRRGSASSGSMSQNFNKHGPANNNHNSHNRNAANAYHSDFPPLGVPGNRNRFNGPNMSGNRRF